MRPDAGPSPAPLEPLDESFETVLCVVAHPDDLEYGTAAAVDRWVKQGKTVTYLLATRGEAGIDGIPPGEAAELRAQEERDGAAKVGVEVVEFLDHVDGVVEYGPALRRDIARVIRRRQPDVIVSGTHEVRFHGGMLNQSDHRAVGLATLDAARDAGNRWIFRELVREGLEPWGGVTSVLVGGTPRPTHFVDVGDHLEPAIASLEAHRAYNEGLPAHFPQPREVVTSILGMGGQAVGVQHALLLEVFQT